MQITLQNLVPEYLEKEKTERSSVWNKQIDINQGEKIQIVAPSGHGKTSLVHFLYGLRKDHSGHILLDKRKISSLDPDEIAEVRKNKMSIIFQDLRLFPEHTAFENIEVKRALHPYHKSSRIEEMGTRLGIGSKLQQQCKKCSYGEQQRIAIIRALQQPFDLLIMDEPFSNLDEVNRKKAMELIDEEAASRNATIILFDLKDIEYFKPDHILYL